MSKSFKLNIFAADHVVYDGECVSLTLPISDGQIGILASHAPMVAAVVPGALRYRTKDGEKAVETRVGCGIASFENDRALVLLASVDAQ